MTPSLLDHLRPSYPESRRTLFPPDGLCEGELRSWILDPLFDCVQGFSPSESLCTSAVLETLAATPYASSLLALDLSGTSPFSDGLLALSLSLSLPRLSILSLEGCSLQPSSMKALAIPHSLLLPRLRVLSLQDASLGPDEAASLLSCDFSSLQHLNLAENRPGLAGITALAQNPTLQNLVTLNLDECHLTDDDIAVLSSSPFLFSLFSLSLQKNRFGIYPFRPVFFPPDSFLCLQSILLEDHDPFPRHRE